MQNLYRHAVTDEPLTIRQIADALRVSWDTVRRAIDDGLPAFKVGKQYRVLYADAVAYFGDQIADCLR